MKTQTFYLENYGCSLNRSDSEKIIAFLEKNNFRRVTSVSTADFVIINACAVKEQTENRMLNRIKKLRELKKRNSKLIVFGCLTLINPKRVSEVAPEAIQIEPSLRALASFFGLQSEEFSPLAEDFRFNPFVSVLPIARGCLSNCSYCAVKSARGELNSYSQKELFEKFKDCVSKTKEVWLTAQDTGCYGVDIGTSLPKLLKKLLTVDGTYRIRVGMLNPQHLKRFYDEYVELFEDNRLYKFFHIPLQSGSDRILKLMNRKYSAKDFEELVKKLREDVKDATVWTDVIVGFPSETDSEFQETIDVLISTKPDVVNISRFGARPNTKALKFPKQLHGRVKKKRSRILTKLCSRISFENNRKLVGSTQEILVTERGLKGFVGRTQSYKPVVVEKNVLGRFVKAKIVDAKATHLVGKII